MEAMCMSIFLPSFENLSNHFNISQIKYFVGDTAYLTSHICKTIIDLKMIPTFHTQERDIEKVISKR